MTAIHTSRSSLRRLVGRQSELEAEIEKEQKQAARLEWLLNRVRGRGAFRCSPAGRRPATPGVSSGAGCEAASLACFGVTESVTAVDDGLTFTLQNPTAPGAVRLCLLWRPGHPDEPDREQMSAVGCAHPPPRHRRAVC